MEEKRKYVRKAVPLGVIVRDVNSGQSLGTLVNLSQNGMMLFCEQPVAVNGVFQCELDVSSTVNCDLGPVKIGIESLWCQPSEQPGAYWAGFDIIDIDAEHSACLEEFLDKL